MWQKSKSRTNILSTRENKMNVGANIELLESYLLTDPGPKIGPIHTIQIDPNGSLYISDELNHAVVSLDNGGKIRWQLSGKGSNSAQFNYPRGIALGWIMNECRPVRCLAVADSWNRRLQFLHLENGGLISEWGAASDSKFMEPVDIRFIPSAIDDPLGGYWLVLDKGAHRLYTIDIDGNTLQRWGTFVDSNTAAKWAKSGAYPDLEKMDGTPPTAPAHYDLLYYPDRLLGRDPQALFLWEPFRLNLKLIAYGHFLPLSIGAFPDREWTAADGAGLLEWSRTESRLNFYDCTGNLVFSGPIEGRPIQSNLPSNEFWLQLDNKIQHLRIIAPDIAEKRNGSPVQYLLLDAAEKNLKDLSVDVFKKAIEPIADIGDELILLADQVLVALKEKSPADERRNGWDKRLDNLAQRWNEARSALYADLRRFNFGILQLRLAFCSGETEYIFDFPPHCRRLWDWLDKSFAAKISELVQRCDDYAILSLKSPESSNAPINKDLSDLRTFAARLSNHILLIIDLILKWHGRDQRSALPLIAPFFESNLDIERRPIPASGTPIFRSKAEIMGAQSISLRELPPIGCTINKDDPGGPTYLALGRDGCLFASLPKANKIVCIDTDGHIRAALGSQGYEPFPFKEPAGIALDGNDRLYIADAYNHRIVVYEPPYKKENLLHVFGFPEVQLLYPHGLFAFGNDRILAADPGTNSIVQIGSAGFITVLLNKIGAELDALRFPCSFLADVENPDKYFWVVDRRNHRLLKLDSSGKGIKQLGRCGLKPGCFFYPGSAAIFSDGIMVVAESPRNPNLVFITMDGVEIERLYLGYTPAGMLVQNDILHVSQYDGNRIRRYVRKQ
jgi:hypothetical protein